MAKAQPCQACLDVPDADYFWTNRLDGPWPFDQATVALCIRCFILKAAEMTEAYHQALASLEANPEPGLLEAVETTEHLDALERSEPKSKSRPKKQPEAVTVPEAVPEETSASDDHS